MDFLLPRIDGPFFFFLVRRCVERVGDVCTARVLARD